MEMIQLIADACGVIGMAYFLNAEIHQWRKIRRTGIFDGISSHAYSNKLFAIIATCSCFALSGLWFSFAVLVAEGAVVGDIYRRMPKIKGPMSVEKFLKVLKKW